MRYTGLPFTPLPVCHLDFMTVLKQLAFDLSVYRTYTALLPVIAGYQLRPPRNKLFIFHYGRATAWRHIMAHISNWHKAEVKIFNNNGSLSPTLTHFRLTNKDVEVTTEIIYVCKLCQFEALISCRNYIIAP